MNPRTPWQAALVVAVMTLLPFAGSALAQAQRPNPQPDPRQPQQSAATPVTKPLANVSQHAVVFDSDAGTETVALFGVLELSHGSRVGIQSRFIRTRVRSSDTGSQPLMGAVTDSDSASVPPGSTAILGAAPEEGVAETWRYQSVVVNVTTLTADSPRDASDPFYRLPIQISRESLGLAGMVPTKTATADARAVSILPQGGDPDDVAPDEVAKDTQTSVDDVTASVWVNHVSLDWLSPEGCQSPLRFGSYYDEAALNITMVATSCGITRQTTGFDSQYQRLSVLSGQWLHEHGGEVVGGEMWLERVKTEASLAAFAGISVSSADAIQDFLPPVVTERWFIAVEAVGAVESDSDNASSLDAKKDDSIKGDSVREDTIRLDNEMQRNASEASATRSHLLVIERSRRRSGTGRAVVSGTLLDAERGVATSLDYRQLAVAPVNNWQHSATGRRYETGWVIDLPKNSAVTHATVSPLTLTAPEHSVDQTVSFGGEERWVGWLSAVSNGVRFAFAEMEGLP